MFTFIVHFLSFWSAVSVIGNIPKSFKPMIPSLRNQFLVIFPLSCCLDLASIISPNSDEFHIWKFIWAVVIQDLVFFSVHKILHVPIIFKNVHYVHHKWVKNHELATIDCHWIEMILGNISPVCVAAWSVNMGFWQWLTWTAFGTCCAVHSHIPRTSMYSNHQRHHDSRHQWFGSIGLADLTIGQLI
jgi:sterol desaturase/sphingolipid hydroxylase (fatty acid hydroxylase superfamily)